MKKKYFVLLFVLAFLISGCGNQNTKNKMTAEQSAIEEKLLELEIRDYQDLTEEERKFLDEHGSLDEFEADLQTQNDVDLANELIELQENKESGKAAKGSCNAIDEASTCLEYVGSIWNDQQMKLNCEGSGTFSKKPCPEGMSGGCNIGVGQISDMITWFYLGGGGEMTKESMKSAQKVCEMTPVSQWLNSK